MEPDLSWTESSVRINVDASNWYATSWPGYFAAEQDRQTLAHHAILSWLCCCNEKVDCSPGGRGTQRRA